MSEETPTTPAEQPADDLDTILDDQTTQEQPPETPEAEPTPEAAAPTTPAPVLAPVETKAPEPQPTASERRLTEIETAMDADDFDPFSKTGRDMLKEHARVAARVEAEPIRRQLHEATIYSQLAEQHDLPVKTLRSEWAKVTKDLAGKSPEVMDYEFERRIDALKLAKTKTAEADPEPAPSAPSKPRIPIKASNGNVAPPVGNRSGNRPPAPTKDAGESFDKSVTAEDLASLV